MSSSDELFDELAEILAVNQDQKERGQQRIDDLYTNVEDIKKSNEETAETISQLDMLLSNDIENTDIELFELDEKINSERTISLKEYDDIEMLETGNWDELVSSARNYANVRELDISNPYFSILSEREIVEINKQIVSEYNLTRLHGRDYAFAASVGIIMGLVDKFFVGDITRQKNNGNDSLRQAVDNLYDKVVVSYANFVNTDGKKFSDVKSAIRFLEKKYAVNYDAATNDSIVGENIDKFNPNNHHAKSIAHWPNLLGLLVGIMDQLSGKTTILADGKIQRVQTNNKGIEFSSQNLVFKIIEAIKNWFGHIISDIAGSSTSKERGAGLPAPFFEALQSLNIGKIGDKDLGELSVWLYEKGLDLRMFTAQAIPVILEEFLVRSYMWFKKKYYLKDDTDEEIAVYKEDISRMLLATTAVFEVGDVTDAVLRSGGLNATVLLKLNYVNLIDMSFRAMQVLKNKVQHVKNLEQKDSILQKEWDRMILDI